MTDSPLQYDLGKNSPRVPEADGRGHWLRLERQELVDDCLALEAVKLSRMITDGASQARFTWRVGRHGCDSAVIRVKLEKEGLGAPTVRLNYIVRSRGRAYAVRQDVATCQTAQWRGSRLWFLCPACGRRCSVLYLKPTETAFRCRVCSKLVYRSQRGTSAKSQPESLSPEETVKRARESIRQDLSDIISAVCTGGAPSSPEPDGRQASAGVVSDQAK